MILLPLALLLSQEEPAHAPPPYVEEVLEGSRTTCGSPDKEFILEVNGTGLALGDFDADGDPDLVVVDGSTLERVGREEPGLPPRLYLNEGGELAPSGESWSMAGGRWGTGAATGDVDGDGYLDLVVLQWGPDRLVRNVGGAGFAEGTEEAGFVGERWGTSGAFLDHDRDGDLDLVVVNYLAFDPAKVPAQADGACRWKGYAVLCGPEGLTPVHDQLYANAGDGTFAEVSVATRFRPERAGFGLGVMTLDFDRDGDTDVYVTNDSTPNHLWQNEGDTWKEVGLRLGVALDSSGKEQAGMGIAVGDINGDGGFDLVTTNFSGESNAIYVTGERRGWRERAAPLGAGGPSVRDLGWGVALEDFDLDGLLEIAVFNGHVYPQADEPGTDTSYAQADRFYDVEWGGRYEPRTLSSAPPSVSRAAAAADLDLDGRPDLVAVTLDGPVRVLRNRTAGGHWLTVRLRGSGSNTSALGALVQAEFDDEPGVAGREVRTSGGYQSAVPAEVYFGLGQAERVRRLTVRWPSGETTVLEDVAADRVLVVEEEP